MRFFRLRTGSILRRFILGLFILSVLSCWILVYHVSSDFKTMKRSPVLTEEKCYHVKGSAHSDLSARRFWETGFNTTLKVEKRVLIAFRKTSVTFRSEIVGVLEANRMAHQFLHLEVLADKTAFPEMTNFDAGKFSVIVFESVKFYLSLGRDNRKILDDYCRKFGVGIILFTEQETNQPDAHVFEEFHLAIKTGVHHLQNVELNPSACLLRLTKAGGIVEKPPNLKWSVFFPNHTSYEAVEFATQEVLFSTEPYKQSPDEGIYEKSILHGKRTSTRYTTVLTDAGDLDGIKRVYFGSGLSFWLHRLLFIDALALLSRGVLARSLERRFVVDIDDIFVGRTGIRMTKQDVKVSP